MMRPPISARSRRRAAPVNVVERWPGVGPAADPPPRRCARPGCPGLMRPRSYRLPSRYVSRAGRDGPVRRVPLLWVWTCERCGHQDHEETGPG